MIKKKKMKMEFIRRFVGLFILYGRFVLLAVGGYVFTMSSYAFSGKERAELFVSGWRFHLGNPEGDASRQDFDDGAWRLLDLPHDWSIEGDFSADHPARKEGGALPGGLGWYRKVFEAPREWQGKKVFVDFDGVYMNSEVFVNGNSLGVRPYGYSSFRYDLTPYLKWGERNVLAVKVDNSTQPNSRWYSGSGIYRNVWLTVVEPVHVGHWGTFVTTPEVTGEKAVMEVRTMVKNDGQAGRRVGVVSTLLDARGRMVAGQSGFVDVPAGGCSEASHTLIMTAPELWSTEHPYLYKVRTELKVDGRSVDTYYTTTGVRHFKFDARTGFWLNGKHMKINGVCMHHDLGCLGAAVNVRAIKRQLEILKEMGCNGIRCTHNPPAPELLDLCDRMGFVVMDEAFDMWRIHKTAYDYACYFDRWHERDLADLVLRDRNHPCIFMWSVGNEVGEQWRNAGRDTLSVEDANILLNFGRDESDLPRLEGTHVNTLLAAKLSGLVRRYDPTRPVLTGNNSGGKDNLLHKPEAGMDIIGYNYCVWDIPKVPKVFPGRPFLLTESISGLMTRGFYRMPSDSMYVWPMRGEVRVPEGSNHLTSAYDNCHVPWGCSHEAGMRMVKNNDFISGQYVWTGFDYIGEPTPFPFPSRSSYFGIIDLAGFPKDVYYMYQSEWAEKPVLHLFPHWNWKEGQKVDLWVYYNQADEVELFVNGKSQGTKRKGRDDFHVAWRVRYEPGTVKAVSRKDGKEVLVREIHTAGVPARIRLTADRDTLCADGRDLAFVTVEVLDRDGNLCPEAENLVHFEVGGQVLIAGVDNGSPFSMERFKDTKRKAFFGKCLVVLQSNGKAGHATLKAVSEGLDGAELKIKMERSR
ncbi:glycosyl hydrolase family 2, sugar binding domain protein [Paraprevotella xylaniphila YIT 11841]|uniref:Glycosyl hydrolase family 2, sugar binding domain protein n=2 Tax=Paraprevotella xylaniphila TaxID=454155 RepID=F3QY23_9BACT|nr:glycosyl hydrolase family 2, sugar binding domain protein [Paraprevotella xylaniphila YIT 11841]